VGYHTSIVLDADGNPHINYWDDDSDNMKHASFNGSSWDIETVESIAYMSDYGVSMAQYQKGYPHISYSSGGGDLKYAYAYCAHTLAGDRNDDCIFNFIDFVIMANGWLVDCDKNPSDPNCISK
jgi:hypothetical protein